MAKAINSDNTFIADDQESEERLEAKRDEMKRTMEHSFKRASFALNLLQQKDMIEGNPEKDVRIFDSSDVNSVVIGKKLVRK